MNISRRQPVVLVIAVLFAAPASAQQVPRKAENVIVVTLDGFRWQELFEGADESFMDAKQGGVRDIAGLKKRYLRDKAEERRQALMPFFWGTIAKKGQVFGNPYKFYHEANPRFFEGTAVEAKLRNEAGAKAAE